MSPVGLNVIEYAYGLFDVTLTDGAPHVIGPKDDGAGWLITKIMVFASATLPCSLYYQSMGVDPIAAGGCVCLEPGGAARGALVLTGDGARMIVEFWYRPAAPNGDPPFIDNV